MGRNTSLTFPDGHTRVQEWDAEGRIKSRCYQYSDPSKTRCYTAVYDAVGNPKTLTDPEGTDTVEYDALNRVKKVTRATAGNPDAVENCDYNALGALKLNAGVALDDQRAKRTGGGDGRRESDAALIAAIRPFIDERVTYGYRRAGGMLNRQRRSEGLPAINHKRFYRVMRAAGLLLARHTGKPTRTRDGRIITLKSDLCWCSDGFEIRCWSGERVQVAFSLDCCDREVMSYVATTGAITGELVRDLMAHAIEHRFGDDARATPHRVEWLSDNAPCYTSHETRAFGEAAGLAICTTPAYSPESNGMAECFVKGFKRDYVYVNRLESAETVMRQLAVWFADYNEVRPHQALKWRSPREYRQQTSTG